MAACPATLSPLPLAVGATGQNYGDDVFLSDTEDDGLLMQHFTPAERFAIGQANGAQQRRQEDAASDEVVLCIEEVEENHSDVDSVAVKIVDNQPRRASADSISGHFQPSQIEEKLQNHRLLSADDGAQQADANAAATNGVVTSSSSRTPRRASIWNGMVACLSPVVGYFKKEKQPKPQQDEWEIEFADISELDFIGSGAQGAVFAGEYLGKKVAVKKVKDPKYLDEAWNLRKLDHPNIVKLT